MRRVILCFIINGLVACGSPPQADSKRNPEVAAAPASQDTISEPQETVADRPQAQPASTPVANTPSGSAPSVMDMAALETQVESIFVQNPKLSAEQAQSMTTTTMDLIQASQAGDQKAVSGLSSKLLNQALLGGPGFGLVDAGALANAIQDLVDAAIDADVAGILDAVDDIVAAVTA